MFPLRYILTNKHNIHINEKFRSCVKHYLILLSDINLDTVKFAKYSLNILVEAKVKQVRAFSKADLYEFAEVQLKSRLVRMSGATRVQT